MTINTNKMNDTNIYHAALCFEGCLNGNCSSPGECNCNSTEWGGPLCDKSMLLKNFQ